jgi:hypothetical protein
MAREYNPRSNLVRQEPHRQDGWSLVTGRPIMIEFDFEPDTVQSLGMAAGHRHD